MVITGCNSKVIKSHKHSFLWFNWLAGILIMHAQTRPSLHQASCKKAPLHRLQLKVRIKEFVRQGIVVSHSLIKFTMDQIGGECDEVLLVVSLLYETTSMYEGLEETHGSVELLLEASQVNSNDKGIVAVTDKRFGDAMKSIELNAIRKASVPVSTKPRTPWAVNVCEAWVNRLGRKNGDSV